MSSLKAGLIGAGKTARLMHLRWYDSNPHVELVSVADADKQLAEGVARDFGMDGVYMDVEEMVSREDLDLVSIVTPTFLHYEHAMAAIEEGVNVLLEKPMAATLEQCDEMLEAVEENDVKLQLGFQKRYNQGVKKVKELIEEGRIGIPHYAFSHWTFFMNSEMLSAWKNSWRNTLKGGGGVFQELEHWVDAFRYLLDDEVESVSGEVNIVDPGMNLEDHAVANLRFGKGAIATVETSFFGPSKNIDTGYPGQIENCGIYGTDGAIMFTIPDWKNPAPPEVRVFDGESNAWEDICFEVDMLDFSHYHYKREIDSFVDYVRKDKSPSPDGVDGRKTQEIVFALYEAWYRGETLRLPLEETPPKDRIFERLKEEGLAGRRSN
ncbi:MAG: Gfo/Idh/MocA family protein [Candidatus Hadarchaeia archaeon]